MNKCAYENRAKTQESLDYAANNPMIDKNEERRKKEKKELEKWEKVKKRKPLKNYFLILLIVITVTYVVDELTSNINGTIKTDVIRFFYNIIGADVNSDEFNAASGNFFVLSLLLYSGVLLAPFYKSLADRFGRRIFLAINTLGMALGMFICMIAPNLVVYLLGSMIMIFVTPNDFHVMYIMEVSPAKHRNKVASITKSLGLLSVSLLGVLRLIFVPDGAGAEAWRYVYLVPVILTVIVGALSFFLVQETPVFVNKRIEYLKQTDEERNQKEEEIKKDASKAQGGVKNAIKYIFQNKQLKWIFIAGLLYALGSGATNYYESVFQIMGSQEAIGVAIVCFPIANAILTSVTGFISDKVGRKKAILFLGIAACVTLVTYVSGAWLNLGGVVAGILYGIFIGCLYSASDILYLVMPAESTPTNLRASVVGTMSLMLFVGTAASWGVIIVFQMLVKDWGLASLATIPFLALAIIITMLKTKETSGIDLDTLTGKEFE
jgi:MFS family permease